MTPRVILRPRAVGDMEQQAGFRNHLIFYRPIEDGIEVLRVLHGACDIDAIFEI